MNPEQQNAWKHQALDAVFEALASSQTLSGRLVYKGARVLNRRLGETARQSFDIDANLTRRFVEAFPDRESQRRELEMEIRLALDRYFAEQDVVRYEVEQVRATLQLKREHPMGWEAFEIAIRLRDLAQIGNRGLPTLRIDIAAPETLGPEATAPLEVGHYEVHAYTLERIAGEKLRAFLSSLPAYRRKFKRPGDAVRAKDLYDIGRIVRARPLTRTDFWDEAGVEFRRACESRYIDCQGLETFAEELDVTQRAYETDPNIPRDLDFEHAWQALTSVVRRLEEIDLVPFSFPLPGVAEEDQR